MEKNNDLVVIAQLIIVGARNSQPLADSQPDYIFDLELNGWDADSDDPVSDLLELDEDNKFLEEYLSQGAEIVDTQSPSRLNPLNALQALASNHPKRPSGGCTTHCHKHSDPILLLHELASRSIANS